MRSNIPAAMTEDQGPGSLDAHVRRFIAELGLWGYHTRNSIGSEKGWPDWTIVGTRILFRELKTESGVLSSHQKLVKYKLLAAHADWKVWRPRDLVSGLIETELKEIVRAR